MCRNNLLYFICISIILNKTFSIDPCENNKSCSACITDSKACVWCGTEQKFNGSRCISEKSVPNNWCPDDIQNPKSIPEVMEDKDFSSDLGNVVQIKPQRIKLKMRPGQTANFNFSFKAANNYPVDIYFLFDASKTMHYLRHDTVKQTEKLYRMMYALTKNVYLGLGTFIDKNSLPYTNHKNSTLTYSFKHELKLTDEFETFKKHVENSKFGSNFDIPEGGFDALAQAIVCKELIGWRNESRKIIVYLTNGLYHAAGDGHWAGITQPYDGECYTNKQRYTKELDLDYPSIGIINYIASKEGVTIFFLISQVEDKYKNLDKYINGARVFSYEEQKSKGIASFLTETYQEITKVVQLKVNKQSDYTDIVKLSFNPNCYENVIKCNVTNTKETSFNGNITLLKYIEPDNITVDIAIQGVTEKLTLDIEMIKECDCKKGDDSVCKGGGKRKCGSCECPPERHGDSCECVKGNATTNDKAACMAANSTIECSGHGACICGSCVCKNRYDGKFCECYTENCPRDNNGVCGGNGRCECGKCQCDAAWTGSACNCHQSKASCLTDATTCFNYGECECGRCNCKPLCEWDARSSQDSLCRPAPCYECHDRQCRLLEPYAFSAFGTDGCNSRINVTTVENLSGLQESDWYNCTNVLVKVGCYTNFTYKYDDESYGIRVIVQSKYDCVDSYYIYGGTCLVVLVLIGIATILAWKILTKIRDRKEFVKFMNEQDLSTMQDNPIFVSATKTFNNPNFRRKSLFFN